MPRASAIPAASSSAAPNAQCTLGVPRTKKVPVAIPISAPSGRKNSTARGAYPAGTLLPCNSSALSGSAPSASSRPVVRARVIAAPSCRPRNTGFSMLSSNVPSTAKIA